LKNNVSGMRYCGRDFTKADINLIRDIICSDPKLNRQKISKLVCEALNWYKRDGGLKDMSCRVAMLRMQNDGLIKLPPPVGRNGNGKINRRRSAACEPKLTMTIPVNSFKELQFELVKERQDSYLWNEYIDRYHYLRFKPLPGAQLRYFVKLKEEIVALFGFGAGAWKTAPRDHFIGWNKEQRENNIHLVVNNARFLILPWITSHNLASRILSMVTKCLSYDWNNRYCYQPVLLESFVENGKFIGTCYKASNWIYVGQTKGLGKVYWGRKENLPKKDIYLYPLKKNFKQLLCS
jgi:hypothetical protein